MFSNFLKSLSNFFSSLFGGKKNTTVTTPKPSPTGDTGTTSPTPGPRPTPRPRPTTPPNPEPPTILPPEPDLPQDASELEPDTVVIVAHEMEEVVLLPNEADQDFDENIFEEEAEDIDEPSPAPEPEPAPILVPESGHEPRFLWCLDNGHGKKTAGKRSPIFDDGETQFLEYEFNRDIVARIIKGLDEEGVHYFNVVPETDIDNFLQGRVNRANRKKTDLPKVYLSIHANAGPATSSKHWAADSIKGVETWYYHGSKKGQKLASVFQKHILEQTGFKNRHLKSRPAKQFYVLRKTAMPSVLTENGFYNNKGEALELMKPSVRQKIADAHIASIMEIEKNGL